MEEVSFIVTGFGPFRGVKDNPTKTLVARIRQFVQERVHIESTHVFVTAADAVKADLEGLFACCDNRKFRIIIHLGVNYKGDRFQLESCAYNNASFRIPDEHGNQPSKEKILERMPIDKFAFTSLNTTQLYETLTKKHKWTQNIYISSDPGRFVCNYTYFLSLSHCTGKDKVLSLFVHVPPFEVLQEDTQLQFLEDLMTSIQIQICEGI